MRFYFSKYSSYNKFIKVLLSFILPHQPAFDENDGYLETDPTRIESTALVRKKDTKRATNFVS